MAQRAPARAGIELVGLGAAVSRISGLSRPSQEPTSTGLTTEGRPEPGPVHDAADVRDGAPEADVADGGGRSGIRGATARVTAAVAGLLLLVALLAPNELSGLTPGAFLRIPVEGLAGVALLLVLPARARPVVAALLGAVLGLLTVLKILDMGFITVLSRPFDPVLDWVLLDGAMNVLTSSLGRVGAIGAAIGAVLLAAAVLVLMTLSALRLNRVVARHRIAAARSVAVLVPVWIICAVLGAQIVPGVPVASGSAATLVHDRTLQVAAGLADQQAFAAAVTVDAFRDTRSDELLTALRGKDVVFAFVESYGRDAVEDPEFASQVGAVLDDGNRRLGAAGFASRSAFLTSPTAGGGSWLAHATLLSGLWVDNQQRYRTLVSSNRLTLTSAFRSASWRTVAVMPGTTQDWPESEFYGHDLVYDARNLDYQGPIFSWAMPDQYALSAFEHLEHGRPDSPPLMAEIALVSSHWPWAPLPRLLDWADVGDGTVYDSIVTEGDPAEVVLSDPARVRTEYRRSIEYSLGSLISYVETYGDDDLVLVLLGDHQPIPAVTGDGASRDVPITIVTRDDGVLDRISGWGWQDGLKPGPQAPVWRMDAFRDRFLTAFGP